MQEFISYDWTATVLNNHLKRKYGYDLFDFAYSLAVALRKTAPLDSFNIWHLKKENILDYQTVQNEVNRLKKLHDILLGELKQHLIAMNGIKNPLFPKEILPGVHLSKDQTDTSLEFMIRFAYKINDSLTTEIEVLSGSLKIFKKSRGASSKSSNMLGCLWSLIMRDTRRIHLDNIENLMNWFYKKLKNTSYQDELRTSPSLEEISRFMRTHKKEMEEDANKIFYGYKINLRMRKTFPFAIRFDADEPHFIRRRTDLANVLHTIQFPKCNSPN